MTDDLLPYTIVIFILFCGLVVSVAQMYRLHMQDALLLGKERDTRIDLINAYAKEIRELKLARDFYQRTTKSAYAYIAHAHHGEINYVGIVDVNQDITYDEAVGLVMAEIWRKQGNARVPILLHVIPIKIPLPAPPEEEKQVE